MGGPPLQLMNPFYRLLVEYITTDPINGIGWITDNITAAQPVCHLRDESDLWIVGVDIKHWTILRRMAILVK